MHLDQLICLVKIRDTHLMLLGGLICLRLMSSDIKALGATLILNVCPASLVTAENLLQNIVWKSLQNGSKFTTYELRTGSQHAARCRMPMDL